LVPEILRTGLPTRFQISFDADNTLQWAVDIRPYKRGEQKLYTALNAAEASRFSACCDRAQQITSA
jgi:hypothetical protein